VTGPPCLLRPFQAGTSAKRDCSGNRRLHVPLRLTIPVTGLVLFRISPASSCLSRFKGMSEQLTLLCKPLPTPPFIAILALRLYVYCSAALQLQTAVACTVTLQCFQSFLSHSAPSSYNATTASLPTYDEAPLQALIDAAMVNQASLWAAYYAVRCLGPNVLENLLHAHTRTLYSTMTHAHIGLRAKTFTLQQNVCLTTDISVWSHHPASRAPLRLVSLTLFACSSRFQSRRQRRFSRHWWW
jgi:hypothetical protein